MIDNEGNFLFNTILFHDLTHNATLAGNEDFTIDFIKEGSVQMAVNVAMVKKIVV